MIPDPKAADGPRARTATRDRAPEDDRIPRVRQAIRDYCRQIEMLQPSSTAAGNAIREIAAIVGL